MIQTKLTPKQLMDDGMMPHAAQAFVELQKAGCPVKEWHSDERGHFWIDAEESGAPGGFITGPVDSAESARALLADVEARLAAAYADLAAEVTSGDRRNAVLSACECSVRSVAWGGPTAAFPGR